MADPYLDTKKDLDHMKALLKQLHMRKEQEITLRRMGKRMPASRVKEMREMETTIETIMDRQRTVVNAQQKNLLENFKNQYRAQMRSWKNRLAFAEKQSARRGRAKPRAFKES